jgi:hypothetical protein
MWCDTTRKRKGGTLRSVAAAFISLIPKTGSHRVCCGRFISRKALTYPSTSMYQNFTVQLLAASTTTLLTKLTWYGVAPTRYDASNIPKVTVFSAPHAMTTPAVLNALLANCVWQVMRLWWWLASPPAPTPATENERAFVNKFDMLVPGHIKMPLLFRSCPFPSVSCFSGLGTM